MRETKFTPGPWRPYIGAMNMTEGGLNPFFRGIVALLRNAGDSEPDVAVILDRNESAADYDANANLIAAAPDGYAFADEFLDWAENFEAAWEWAASGEATGEALVHDPGWQGLKQLAEAFIAKARGEVRL